MPRTARAPSHFRDDTHVLYAAWVIDRLSRSGVQAHPVKDPAGNITDKLTFAAPLGGDGPQTVTLAIPYPPEGWQFIPSP